MVKWLYIKIYQICKVKRGIQKCVYTRGQSLTGSVLSGRSRSRIIPKSRAEYELQIKQALRA